MASATQTPVALFASSNDGLSLRYGREGNYKEEHLVGFTVKAKVSERKNNLRGKSWRTGSKKQQKGTIRSAFGGTDEYCRTPEQSFWLLISGFENDQKRTHQFLSWWFCQKLKHLKPSFNKLTPNCGKNVDKLLPSCQLSLSYCQSFPKQLQHQQQHQKIENTSSTS